jgi:hypothetical protein
MIIFKKSNGRGLKRGDSMRDPILVTFWFTLFLFSCSSIAVKSDYDPTIDFKSYKTYRWVDFENMNDDDLAKNPLLRERIISAVDYELLKKNFVLKESDNVDLLLIVHGLRQEKLDVNEWGVGYRYDPWWDPEDGAVDVSHYKQGTLVIDVVDAQSDELIWRGLGTCILKDHCDPEDMQKAAKKYVAKVLSDFPPERE